MLASSQYFQNSASVELIGRLADRSPVEPSDGVGCQDENAARSFLRNTCDYGVSLEPSHMLHKRPGVRKSGLGRLVDLRRNHIKCEACPMQEVLSRGRATCQHQAKLGHTRS